MKVELPKMSTDKISNLIGAYLAIGLIVALLVFFAVIKPTFTKAASLGRDIASVNGKIAALNQLSVDTESLRGNYQAIKYRRDQILAQLPVKSEEERLLALLSNLASSSGVVMGNFSPAGVQSTGSLASISTYGVSTSTSGSYESIQKFLGRIEEAARFIDIKSVSLAGQGGSLQASLSLNAYYQDKAGE